MNTIMKRKESPFTGIWSNLLDQDFFGMPSYEHAVHTLPKVNIIEDNDNYKKFKKRERLIFNVSNSKYFVIRFVAKHLFNFKLSYKN